MKFKVIKESINKINESEETYTFIKLFKDVESANRLLDAVGSILYVKFYTDDSIYGDEHLFTSYRDFKKFISDEYNSAKEILNSNFIIGLDFDIEWLGGTSTHRVELVLEDK